MNPPFPYWMEIEPLMSLMTKGRYVFRPSSHSTAEHGSGSCAHNLKKVSSPSIIASSTSAAGSITPTLNLTTEAVTAITATRGDPNSIVPSTPSSYLSESHPILSAPVSTAGSSVITSISRQKCKSAAVSGSESVADSQHSSRKCAHPLSTAVQAQVNASKSMQKLSAAFQFFFQDLHNNNSKTSAPAQVPIPTPVPPAGSNTNITACAALALAKLPLFADEMNNLAEYMQDEKNKGSVIFFLAFPHAARLLWVQKRLKEIHNAHLLDKTP